MPYILSTVENWIVVSVEDRKDMGNWIYMYTKKLYRNGEYLDIIANINKKSEKKIKPYGLNVVLSSWDGRYYTNSAHLSSINQDIIRRDNINRWDVIWVIWTSGNSSGIHLHFEVRYCWENNQSIWKQMNRCIPLNPLWFPKELWWIKNKDGVNFLWLRDIKWWYVSAWEVKIIKEVIVEDKIKESLKVYKEKFCNNTKLLFIWKSIECDVVFPIYYQYSTYEDVRFIIDFIYWIEEQGGGVWKGQEGKNKEEKNWSNSNINNKSDDSKNNQDTIKKIIREFDDLKKRNNTPESLYLTYFKEKFWWWYEKNKNPYIYNLMDKDSIYLPLLDEEGNEVEKWKGYWTLTIYNLIKT